MSTKDSPHKFELPASLQQRLRDVKINIAAGRAFFAAFKGKLTEQHPGPTTAELRALPPGAMRIWARRVHLYLEPDLMLKLDGFVADLQALDTTLPLMPDQRHTYTFAILEGEIRVPAASLEVMLNRFVLPEVGHPLKEVRIAFQNDRMIMRAKIHRLGMDLPITVESQLSVGPEGMIELLPERLAVSEVGVGGMFRFLRLDLEHLVDLRDGGPFRIKGNQISVDPAAIFPAPKASGRPGSVRVERGELVLVYPSEHPEPPPMLIDPQAPNYLLCAGHDLLIGKMLISDAYFQIVNQEPAPHLDFSLEHYREQLAAGQSSLGSGDRMLVRLPNLAPVARRGVEV